MENLIAPKGSNKKRKRIGRGPGSGHGKTSCKGHKGQNARKGGGVRIGFEGGQTPLFRRLPKRGFKNFKFKKHFNEINIYILNQFDDNSIIKLEDLIKLDNNNSKIKKIKILGNGDLKKKLEIHANKFSKAAITKIEAAGGKAVLIQ